MDEVKYVAVEAPCCGIVAVGGKGRLLDALKYELWSSSWVHFNFEPPLLRITMPCGEVIQWESFDEIPSESIVCSCGNPSHWFIKYIDPIFDIYGIKEILKERLNVPK